jgi:hypothetical protein
MPETKKIVNKKPVNTQARHALQLVFQASPSSAHAAQVRSRAALPRNMEVVNKTRAF